jgi:hypothetical protein
VFIYGVALKSLSADMLSAIQSASQNGLTLDELTEAVSRPAYAERGDLLVKKGFATVIDGRYSSTEAGRTAAYRIHSWQRILNLKLTGLYGLRSSSS